MMEKETNSESMLEMMSKDMLEELTDGKGEDEDEQQQPCELCDIFTEPLGEENSQD